jgi:hypothetical protein
MALTKVTEFGGEAEVMGGLRLVRYDAPVLSISGLSLEDAYAVLEKLASKSIQAVRVGGPAAGSTVEVPRAAASPRALVEAMATSPSLSSAPKEAVQEAAPWVGQGAKKVSETESAAPAAQPSPAIEGVPEKVAKTGRFIEVLDWVMKSKGFKPSDVEAIIAECEKLRALPVVSRVRDLRDKVVSNLAAYGEAGEG